MIGRYIYVCIINHVMALCTVMLSDLRIKHHHHHHHHHTITSEHHQYGSCYFKSAQVVNIQYMQYSTVQICPLEQSMTT